MKAKTKYEKVFTALWKCESCEYEWRYKSRRCPVCSSIKIRIISEK